MKKELEIGQDYGSIFGLDAVKGQKIIYLGGIKFRAINGSAERELDSQGTFDKIYEYINRPSIHMGKIA